MNQHNKINHPFLMLLSVTALLLAASIFFSTEIEVFGFKTKKISLLDDILLKGALKKSPILAVAVTDSVIAKDSTAFAMRQKDPANILDYDISDSTSALANFFEALNQLKKSKRKVRVAYFGDSMIEGDLISQDLRAYLQSKFGGYGVGFVPVTSVIAGFRTSVGHSFSGWSTYNLLDEAPKSHSLGIAGYCFVPSVVSSFDTSNLKLGSTVKYVASNKKCVDKFSEVKILYGNSNAENNVIVNGKCYKLEGSKAVNELCIKPGADIKSVNACFQCKQAIDVYGFSMESDSGVFVDNFSFRGNSGLPLTKIPQTIYSQTQECLNYDLIILEYGLNAVSSKSFDYSWYERGMNNVVKYLQQCFPNTSILLVSVGDKGYRNNGVYESDPGVLPMIETQKRIAKNNKLAFWSLYDAMGGSGSMVKWAESDTALANKDYTHFNFRGAHKIGKLFYEKLVSEYADYNKKKFALEK
jgi:hypothetical protein